MRNMRTTSRIVYQGQVMPTRDFVELLGLKYRPHVVTRMVLREGLTGEQVIEREKHSWRAGLRYRKRGSEASVCDGGKHSP